MQIEFTNIDILIAQANPHGVPLKAVRPATKKSKTSPRKHIAEQFEFPFVRQMSQAKSPCLVPVVFVGSAEETLIVISK